MSDKQPAPTWENPIWHRGYRIYLHDNIGPYNYDFVHDDYDGADDAYDNRCGHADSVEEAKKLIDEIEDEDGKE